MNGDMEHTSMLLEVGSLHDSSFRGSIQIDDDAKKPQKENDCAMSTILQPTAMLRREVALHDACRKNDTEMVKKILSDKIDVDCRNNLDRTPLQWACAKGYASIAELLIEAGADLESRDKYGMRAVLWAALYGHLDVLQLLINAGATASCTNKQGMGVLHCATQNNSIKVMNFIFQSLENLDINAVEKDMFSAELFPVLRLQKDD